MFFRMERDCRMSAVPLSRSIFPIHTGIIHYAPQYYSASLRVRFLYHGADAALVGGGVCEFNQFLVIDSQFFFFHSLAVICQSIFSSSVSATSRPPRHNVIVPGTKPMSSYATCLR